MRLSRLLAASVVAGFAGLLLGPSADAAGGVQAAYWWVGQPDTAGVPAPPQVPAGGLYVSSTSAGPSAVSAIRFTLSTREQAPVLVLRVHQLQQFDGLSIDAYPATGRWQGGDAQSWSTRPAFDAKKLPVKGVLNAAATTVTFALGAVAPGSTIDLVLVPGPVTTTSAPVAPPNPTFDASFEPVRSADIRTTAVPPHPSGHQPTPSPTPQPTGATAGSSPPDRGVLVPALPGSTAQPAPTDTVPTPVVAQQPVVPQPAASTSVRSGRSNRDMFILAFLLADAMAFVAWRARAGHAGTGPGAGRISIYDLPPSPTAEPGPS
ncbi:MAG: hypothetical protein QOJ03_1624 [Frankiaceae bacterium]|nr:hypothetical protein [Frankiaceae bacterium]